MKLVLKNNLRIFYFIKFLFCHRYNKLAGLKLHTSRRLLGMAIKVVQSHDNTMCRQPNFKYSQDLDKYTCTCMTLYDVFWQTLVSPHNKQAFSPLNRFMAYLTTSYYGVIFKIQIFIVQIVEKLIECQI